LKGNQVKLFQFEVEVSRERVEKMSSQNYFLKTHELTGEEFIGTIQIEKNANSQQDPSLVQTVIILDRSGSMGQAVGRMVNEIIPKSLTKLSYDNLQVVHLITFDTVTELFSESIRNFRTKTTIGSRGGTVMTPAINKLEELFKTFDYIKPIRLLTISDGQVHDRANVQTAAGNLVKFLGDHDFSINSQAVRFFTGVNQPDTTALASLLQINNTTTSALIDISTSETNEVIAERIADLFRSDQLDYGRALTTKEKIIVKYPWESSASSQLTLTPGENLFWLKSIPTDEAKVDKYRVSVVPQQPLTLLKFQALMDGKLDYIVDHMRILKVIGSSETENIVNQMLQYFEQKEEFLIRKSFIVQWFGLDWIHRTKISKVLEIIAKEDNIQKLGPAEKAEYLRQAGFTKENPTFVERLFDFGIDIDSEESRRMFIVLIVAFFAWVFVKVFGN
jgi:hypothetical protein